MSTKPGEVHYGRVAYIHGPGFDQPLQLYRMEYGDTNVVFAPFDVSLHYNWRGHIDDGTIDGGAISSHCARTVHWNADHPPEYDTTWVCVQADWAAPYSATLRTKKPLNPVSWFGSLVKSKTDGSGQMYMRNRYYDPTSGRFTQEDPIALAGGLNAYGFAAGDPVNFSDPLGLCPEEKGGDGRTNDLSDCPKGTAGYEEFRNPPGLENVSWDTFWTVASVVNGAAALRNGIRALFGVFSRRAAGAVAAAAAGRSLVPEGEALLVIVKDGKIVKQTSDIMMSHTRLLEQTFGSAVLPEGAWVGTIGKYQGVVSALNSASVMGNQAAAPAAIQALIRSLFY